MPGCDLCSAVFILRPQRMFPVQYRFMGRMVQRMFLLMLNQAGYSDLANELHKPNERHPFTVSDLFQNGSQHYWMRVTGLNPQLCEVLQHMTTMLPGQSIQTPARESVDEASWSASVEAALITQHEWAGQATYAGLVKATWEQPTGGQLILNFMTPTLLKSVGVYRLFPEPALVFRLLYERLLKTGGIILPFQPEVAHLEAFAEYLIEVANYEIACAHMPLKRGRVAAFYGLVTYQVLSGNNDFHKRAKNRQSKYDDPGLMTIYQHIQNQKQQYACLVNLLAAFAFYSGLGSYTGQGMGMVGRVG